MSNEILINVSPQETRVAVVEQGVLQEIFVQRASHAGVMGNIYKGKVARVLPGMQAAFIDVGLDRTAFLHASDIQRDAKQAEIASDAPDITTMLREGESVLVQVVKEPLGSKGARLTSQLTIPSRYLVFLPNAEHVGISTKIEDEEERSRLRDVLGELIAESGRPGSFIVRTAGEGVHAEELRNDVTFLHRLWDSIQEAAPTAPAASLVHSDLPLIMRTLRDVMNDDIERVRIDDEASYKRCLNFAQRFVPGAAEKLEYFDSDAPIFDLYGAEDELQRALDRKVPLKSGGHLIFDQTEAMTTVDVNTGAFVGYRNLEETIFKTNLESAHTIAHQLRLRNLGGIIIIDFIDMADEMHKNQVLSALEKAMAKDHAKSVICSLSSLGLVEMTRKRTRESLERILCEPCPTCMSRGRIKSAETVCYEIFRELRRTARQFQAREYRVLAHPDVIARLVEEQSDGLAELEEVMHKPIRLLAEAQYLPESYDVVPL
ncbi:MAG: ribonuclease G [Oceanococcus sp.]